MVAILAMLLVLGSLAAARNACAIEALLQRQSCTWWPMEHVGFRYGRERISDSEIERYLAEATVLDRPIAAKLVVRLAREGRTDEAAAWLSRLPPWRSIRNVALEVVASSGPARAYQLLANATGVSTPDTTTMYLLADLAAGQDHVASLYWLRRASDSDDAHGSPWLAARLSILTADGRREVASELAHEFANSADPDGAAAAHYYLADQAVRAGEFESAGRHVEESLRRNPHNSGSQLLNAQIAFEKRDYRRARRDAAALLADYYFRAAALCLMGDAAIALDLPATANHEWALGGCGNRSGPVSRLRAD